MNVREKFSGLLRSESFVKKLAGLLAENPEEFLSEDQLDEGFEPSEEWLIEYIKTTALDNAVKRILSKEGFTSERVYVYRGINCHPDEYEQHDAYARANPMNVSKTFSYTLSKEVAHRFAGPKGIIIGGLLNEETIAWEHFLYLHIVYPGASDLEFEIPSLPRQLEEEKIVWRGI